MARSALGICLIAALGCSSEPEFRPSPGYPAVAFKDNAPSNRDLTTDTLPTAFVDHEGKPVDLAGYKGKKNLVLVVVRGIPQTQGGALCEYCVAQAHTMSANYAEFEKRDAEVLVVFPGPSEKVSDFINRAAGKPKFPFPLLLDSDMKACDRLGIRGDLAKPSTYVVDKKGNVVYAYVGETITDRPSVKAVYGQLDKLRNRTRPTPLVEQ